MRIYPHHINKIHSLYISIFSIGVSFLALITFRVGYFLHSRKIRVVCIQAIKISGQYFGSASRGRGVVVNNSTDVKIRIFLTVTFIRIGSQAKVVFLFCYAPATSQ